MSPDGIRVQSLGLAPEPNVLYVVNAHLRSYLALGRDGTYLHSIRPARLDDRVVGDGKRQAGELICSCVAGEYGRPCYWTQLAEALEKGDVGFVLGRPIPDEQIAWMREEVSVP